MHKGAQGIRNKLVSNEMSDGLSEIICCLFPPATESTESDKFMLFSFAALFENCCADMMQRQIHNKKKKRVT